MNAITRLRETDGVGDDVYYYGAFTPKSSFDSYCGGGCVTGLSTVADTTTPFLRASVGIGYTGSDAAETMAHEVGHAHGRSHSPCGGATGVDPDYPYAGASLGVPGYDIVKKALVSASKYHDMMGYCPPSWVSDYTYGALLDRISEVSTSVSGSSPLVAGAPAETYRTAEVQADGSIKWTHDVVLNQAPAGGESRTVKFLASSGVEIESASAHFYPYDHLPGGVLVVPQAKASWASAKVGSASITPAY